MAQRYTKEVLDILRAADEPLRTREIQDRIEDGRKYPNYIAVAAAVSRLYRDGELDRAPVSGMGNTYAYSIATNRPIAPGYTWRDELGPMCVMAVAGGYAMARRPGREPFVIALSEIIAKARG